MDFSEKLVSLRKQRGLTQEELAEKIGVSRQSISKWESKVSFPDLEKIVKLSEVFNVSIDYLLKENGEDGHEIPLEKKDGVRKKLSLEEVKTYLQLNGRASEIISAAIMLFILSPISLINLSVVGEQNSYGLSEDVAIGLGMIISLIVVVIAVSLLIINHHRMDSFEFLEKEEFEIDENTGIFVNEQKDAYRKKSLNMKILGISLCILSVIPIFVGSVLFDSDLWMTSMVSLLLVIAGIGVMLLVRNEILWSGFEKILQEGDYTREKKEEEKANKSIGAVYWPLVVAVFLGYSFITDHWGYSWIIFIVGAGLYPLVKYLIKAKV